MLGQAQQNVSNGRANRLGRLLGKLELTLNLRSFFCLRRFDARICC